MRFYTRSLTEQYTYPCSKAAVKAAFGDELLGSACFGLSPKFTFEARYSPRPRILGNVILALAATETQASAPDIDRSSLYIYRVLKKDFTEPTHDAVVDLMKGQMRRWLDSNIGRSETEVFGLDVLLVELRSGQLLVHETRFR